jgi:hypothetical protein
MFHIKDIKHTKPFRLIVDFWRRFFPAAVEPSPEKPKSKPKDGNVAGDHVTGEFYFRETILDQLDYYMKCLARMRRADPESFEVYSRLGAHVIPETTAVWGDELGYTTELPPWFRQTLPSFGAIFFGKTARDDEAIDRKRMLPRFFYFTKFNASKAPPEVQRASAGTTIYLVTVYWDQPEGNHKMKVGAPTEYPVVILPDGSMKLLRVLVPDDKIIRHKHGQDRGKTFTIPRRRWVDANPFFVDWAKEHKRPVDEYLIDAFVRVASYFETAQSSVIRVAATRGDLTAAFGVCIKRTPYFFKDRDVVLNQNGNRKRIFHIVRPHIRKSGKAVKLHFRGEKIFDWNDYQIRITVPGKDHHHLNEFDVGLSDSRKIIGPGVSTKRIAEEWKDHLNGSELFPNYVERNNP